MARDALLGCYADDFTLHYVGDNPFTGTHAGKDAAVAVLAEVSERASDPDAARRG